ncbi:DNA sulfur modification protein DndD [Methanocalculus sp.]|uniref:DNA sulfur modification protein DndD n=1 Tax=Methanocalculus sp. TaxID=2004547 RepID=UPI002605042D|nr:DNA sulfur modification protein DndD [Methanocalculus sp.]MDG6251298.1 DNA sulfur modification protein DndD [Methanocalculus sp.]
MLITKLTLNNFGLFKGKNEFDLRPTKNNGCIQPIILFGGKNGAGKTTLFDAFRIGLYGPNLDEYRYKKREYNKYILDHFHQNVNSQLSCDSASIEIEFEYAHLGEKDYFKITRAWIRHKEELKESLSVTRNGEKIDDLEVSQWQDFINELIPPGISKLFFFDGEKIQLLAEDDKNNTHLKRSFKTLLGLNIVDKLSSDLGIYISRKAKTSGEKEIQKEILRHEKEHSELEQSLDTLRQQRAELNAKYHQKLGKLDEQEVLVAHEGGSFSDRRNELKLEKIQLENDIERTRSNIRELCSNLLPFSLTPKYCELFKSRLLEEEKYTQWQNTQRIFEEKIDNFSKAINAANHWEDIRISSDERSEIIHRMVDLFRTTFSQDDKYHNFRPFHALSQKETQKLLNWIDESQTKTPVELKNLTEKLEQFTDKRNRVEKALQRAPEDDVIGPIIQALNKLNQEIGQYEEQLRQMDEKIRILEYKLDEVNKNREICFNQLKEIENVSNQVAMANSVREIVLEYSDKLQKAKINEFGEIFLSCFNRLLRKGEYITGVDINIKDFSLTLYSRSGQVIPKTNLSVGEKQIYAVAMLWALTLASRRPLPFIIDTPLGRLDSEHRGNLVGEFFPKASHQMLIFSTDTEIDLNYFKDLRPNIAKAYHLDFNKEDGATKVTEGYFWNGLAEVEN